MTVPPYPCPFCNKELDGATALDREATPSDGDISMCIYCGNFGIFDGGKTRKPTLEEAIDKIAGNWDCFRAWKTWKKVNKKE